MRERKEIETEVLKIADNTLFKDYAMNVVQIEILLDIRDLLQDLKEK